MGNATIRDKAANFIDSVGVCTHFVKKDTLYFSRFEPVLDLLLNLGVDHIRDDAVITTDDLPNGSLYSHLKKCVDHGLRLSMICFDPLDAYIYTPPTLLENLYDWCGEGIVLLEGSNEPPLEKNPRRFPLVSAEHQISLYNVAKSNPRLKNIPVAGPSYVQESVKLAIPIHKFCDYANIHAYAGAEHPESDGAGSLTKFVTESTRIFGAKPVIVSEIGYHSAIKETATHLPVSAEIKTRYIPRTILWSFIQGSVRTYIYELVSSFNNGLDDKESHFGLIDYDLRPGGAYLQVQRLLSLCRRSSRPASLPAADLRVSFAEADRDRAILELEREDGSLIVIVWLMLDGWDREQMQTLPPVERRARFTVSNPHARVRSYLFLDNGTVESSDLVQADGFFTMYVRDQLTVLEFFKA